MLLVSHWGLPLPTQFCRNWPFGTKPSPIDPTNQASYAHTPLWCIPTLLSLPTNWQAFSFGFLSSFISSHVVRIDNFLTAKHQMGWGFFSLFSSKKRKFNKPQKLEKSDSYPNLGRGWVPFWVAYCSSPLDHIPTAPLVLGLLSVLPSQMQATKYPCE